MMKYRRNHSEETIKKANIRLHEAIAAEYDDRQAIFHPLVQKNLKSIINMLPFSETTKALDIGCGTGNISKLLGEAGFTVSGFDITKQMVGLAKESFQGGAFIVADVFAPPFQDESFKIVSISGVLHHVIDYETVIHNAVSLLEPGGYLLILNEPNAGGYRFFKPVRSLTAALFPEKRVMRRRDSGEISEEEEKLAEYHLNFADGIDVDVLKRILEAERCEIVKLQYTNLNMMGNIGDRLGIDILKAAPWMAKLPGSRISLDFNLIAVKHL